MLLFKFNPLFLTEPFLSAKKIDGSEILKEKLQKTEQKEKKKKN